MSRPSSPRPPFGARPAPRRAVGRAIVRATVRAAAAGAIVAAPVATACGPRAVEVGTGAAPAPVTTTFEFTNNLPQAVNVYLRGPDGAEVFLRQVTARTTETVPVRGVAEGAAVQLRIAPVDGAANIVRSNVVVGRGTPVRVP
jgi:hypothetical protein